MKKTLEVLGLVFVVIGGAMFGAMATAYGLGAFITSSMQSGALREHLPRVSDALMPFVVPVLNILILMLTFVMIIATMLTLAERKWSAMMQDRMGPNRARLAIPGLSNRALGGLPHVAADSVKMLFKEDFRPASANDFLFKLGPILAFAPVFALFAVVPAGPTVRAFGVDVGMFVSNPNFGVLYLFAVASLAVYGTSLAGWASNNKFALLGGVRAASQMISYEVALGLSLVGMMVAFSCVQLPQIVEFQANWIWGGAGIVDVGLPAWGIFLQPLGFVIFFAAAFAETKRAPFDVPEGESEIIGYFVEYSGMKFGMFMISEFVEVVVLAAVSAAIFFGGYHLPFGERFLHDQLMGVRFLQENPSLREIFWGGALGTFFWFKVLLLCWVQLAIRWTFPRFRYDQIQTLGWKILLPAGLLNLFVTGGLILWDTSLRTLTAVGLLEIGVVVALSLSKKEPQAHPAAVVAHGH